MPGRGNRGLAVLWTFFGSWSHAIFFRFHETTVVDSQACRDAFLNKGLIEVIGRTYSAVIGTTSSHQEFLTGGLDDSGNCEVDQFHNTGSRKTLGYQVAQRIIEISLFNE